MWQWFIRIYCEMISIKLTNTFTGVMSAPRQHKMSLALCPLWQLKPGIHLYTEFLCRTYGIQYHTLRFWRRVSLTCPSSGNRQADHSTGFWTGSIPWTSFISFQLWPGSTWRMLTWADIHGWESLCKNPGFQRCSSTLLEEKRKKYLFYILKVCVWIWI